MTPTDTKEGHNVASVMYLQAKECQGLVANSLLAGRGKEGPSRHTPTPHRCQRDHSPADSFTSDYQPPEL